MASALAPSTGYTAAAARQPEFLQGNRRDGSEVHDQVFRLPLWLQQPCASGRLWAYGTAHLDAIEQHLRARVRLADGTPTCPRTRSTCRTG